MWNSLKGTIMRIRQINLVVVSVVKKWAEIHTVRLGSERRWAFLSWETSRAWTAAKHSSGKADKVLRQNWGEGQGQGETLTPALRRHPQGQSDGRSTSPFGHSATIASIEDSGSSVNGLSVEWLSRVSTLQFKEINSHSHLIYSCASSSFFSYLFTGVWQKSGLNGHRWKSRQTRSLSGLDKLMNLTIHSIKL